VSLPIAFIDVYFLISDGDYVQYNLLIEAKQNTPFLLTGAYITSHDIQYFKFDMDT
jgi:hypothetical protein